MFKQYPSVSSFHPTQRCDEPHDVDLVDVDIVDVDMSLLPALPESHEDYHARFEERMWTP